MAVSIEKNTNIEPSLGDNLEGKESNFNFPKISSISTWGEFKIVLAAFVILRAAGNDVFSQEKYTYNSAKNPGPTEQTNHTLLNNSDITLPISSNYSNLLLELRQHYPNTNHVQFPGFSDEIDTVNFIQVTHPHDGYQGIIIFPESIHPGIDGFDSLVVHINTLGFQYFINQNESSLEQTIASICATLQGEECSLASTPRLEELDSLLTSYGIVHAAGSTLNPNGEYIYCPIFIPAGTIALQNSAVWEFYQDRNQEQSSFLEATNTLAYFLQNTGDLQNLTDEIRSDLGMQLAGVSFVRPNQAVYDFVTFLHDFVSAVDETRTLGDDFSIYTDPSGNRFRYVAKLLRSTNPYLNYNQVFIIPDEEVLPEGLTLPPQSYIFRRRTFVSDWQNVSDLFEQTTDFSHPSNLAFNVANLFRNRPDIFEIWDLIIPEINENQDLILASYRVFNQEGFPDIYVVDYPASPEHLQAVRDAYPSAVVYQLQAGQDPQDAFNQMIELAGMAERLDANNQPRVNPLTETPLVVNSGLGNSSFQIEFTPHSIGAYDLVIFNLLGQEVERAHFANCPALTSQRYNFNGSNRSSGPLFVALLSNNQVLATERFILLK